MSEEQLIDKTKKPRKKSDYQIARAEATRFVVNNHLPEFKERMETILGHPLDNYHIEMLKAGGMPEELKKKIRAANTARHKADRVLQGRHADEYYGLKNQYEKEERERVEKENAEKGKTH